MNKLLDWFGNLALSVIRWLLLFKVLDRMTDIIVDIIREVRRG